MFESSVMLTQFSAGAGIDAIEGRVKRLESMLAAVEAQKRKARATNAVSDPDKTAFKSFLGHTTPPPKIQPLAGTQKERCESLQPLIMKFASQHGVDPELVNAVIRQESGFNPNAVSRCGAQGLMQLMPGTAKQLGVANAFDPVQNLEGGIRHLAGLLQKYHGNIALALAAYNAGGGAVDRHKGIPPYRETQQYVRKILAGYLHVKNQSTTETLIVENQES